MTFDRADSDIDGTTDAQAASRAILEYASSELISSGNAVLLFSPPVIWRVVVGLLQSVPVMFTLSILMAIVATVAWPIPWLALGVPLLFVALLSLRFYTLCRYCRLPIQVQVFDDGIAIDARLQFPKGLQVAKADVREIKFERSFWFAVSGVRFMHITAMNHAWKDFERITLEFAAPESAVWDLVGRLGQLNYPVTRQSIAKC